MVLRRTPHWRAISAALQLAGYQKVWSQDVAIHQLTANHRSRWLSVWRRQDVACQKSTERLLCATNRRVAWNDSKHLVALPASVRADLTLTPDQVQIYGNRAKKARVVEGSTTHQVLTERIAQGGEYLPTLCASYTAQHLLQKEHLELKGIFAALTHKNEEVCFIDPFVFVSLFGTTDSIALPADLRKAFHQLGKPSRKSTALLPFFLRLKVWLVNPSTRCS